MPLPSTDTARSLEWPPPAVAKYTRQQAEWAAWWAGDVDKLRKFSAERRFWHRDAEATRTAPGTKQARTMHAAVAADIVTTSADLLFGTPPTLTIPTPEATGDDAEHVDVDADGIDDGNASVDQATALVDQTQARLDELRDLIDFDGLALIAGEVSAALGGAWFRPAWDTAVADHPLLTIVDPDQAIPEYSSGVLRAVTFWEEVATTSTTVWRHLERHEIAPERDEHGDLVGVILHGLYEGTESTLGTFRPLTAQSATAALPDAVPVPKGAGPIMPRCMPNVLPNRKNRRMPIGRSDFDGAEDELDAVDEVWSSLLRDVRLGVARVFAREGTLTRMGSGPGSGRGFNVDQELIVETETDPDVAGDPVKLTQAVIREVSHLAIVRALVEQAVSAAGYAPATFGLGIDGAAESGTARSIRERKTFRTLRKKRRNAERAIADVWRSLLAIDADVFSHTLDPVRPSVVWPDVEADQRTTAEWVTMLRQAQAVSIETAVRLTQPDLDDTAIGEEVGRIMAENSLTDPDTLGADSPGDVVDPELDDPADDE
jgi:hypothetical protein